MKARKLISLILSVAIILSSFSVCCLAAEKYNYVVLGDSIAYGSGLLNATEACYGKLVADTCGFNYANHAVPGATTSEFLDELKKKNVRADLSRADIVSISIGGNDYLNELSALMFDSIVKKDYTAFDIVGEGIYTNIKKAIDIILGLSPDAVILLQTLYNPMSGYLKESYQQGADRVNAAVYRCAKEYPRNVAVVDLDSVLTGDEENFADDTMHPTAKGNVKIAREVLSALRALGFTKKTKLTTDTIGIDVHIGPVVSQTLELYAFFLHAIAKALDAISMVMG